MESLSLIDVSAEDDLFLGLASPPQLPDRDPPRAGFRVGAEAAADSGPAGGSPAEAAAPERAESPKQRKAKTGVNLRKSLAWDSAFFTSEGVLDTEELAIVNSTFRKTQGSWLPGITEETRRSEESTTSTLESESWAMESMETELFDNVRASIQRSLGKPNKATARPPANSKPPRATENVPRVAAKKGVDRMPQIKVRAPVSTSQGVGGEQRPQVTSKEATAARVKTLPEDGGAKPSSRPPRALPRVATMRSSTNTSIASGISDKRSSTGGVVHRQAVGKSVSTSVNLRPGGVMKSSSVPKSGALTAAATKPDTKTKSATLSSTKRTAQRILVRSLSKSDCSKTNPTRLSENKIPARGHNDRASPTISPNSSIDSISSVISEVSTASTVGKMSYTSESFSSLSASLPPSLRKSNDHPLTTKLRTPIVTEGQCSGTAASGDSLIATAGTSDQGKGSKLSGLRRPNPKIGYFDAEKSTDQVQSTKIQRLLPATPKSKLSSIQMMSATSSSFGQQEPKYTAPPAESGASKSREAKALSVKVAQMDAVPFKVAEPEVCTHETGLVVSQTEAEKSIVQTVSAQVQLQTMGIKCPPLATPNSQQSSTETMIVASSLTSQKESKSTAVSVDEIIASTGEAVPLKVAQIEVEPSPVAQKETIASTIEAVKVDVPEACSYETGPVLLEPEACSYETGPVLLEHEAEKSIDQNIGAQVQGQAMETQLSLPGTPNSQLSSTQTTNPATSTLDQQELRPTEAPHEESNSLKIKAENVVALKVAKAGAEPFEVSDLSVVKTEVVKVAENEAFMHQTSPLVTTAEASKENIPALHQNVQANDDDSSLSVELLIQKLSSVSLGPDPDMTS